MFPRASDVVRIHRAVTGRLSGSWYDEEDLTCAATEALRSGRQMEPAPVIIHLLSNFTATEAKLVRALDEHGNLLVNIGVTGEPAADMPVLTAHRRIGLDVEYPDGIDTPCAARIVSVSDPDDEVRAAVRRVTAWIRGGVRLGRIAVVYPSADPYARLLGEQLGAARIPSTGTPDRRLHDMMAGRTLRALLALPDNKFRRSDVLGLLSSSPVLNADARVHDRAWERVSRKAGVVGGDDWAIRLAALAQEERDLAARDDEDRLERRADRRRKDADHADALAAFVKRLRDDLAATTTKTWGEWAEWAHRLLRSYLGDERRRARWPEEEQQAADRVEEALDRLDGIDSLDGPSPTLGIFRRTLDTELSGSVRRTGSSGTGVVLGQVASVAGVRVDRLIVLGMSEGRFPARRLQDSLLPDVERQAAGGYLPLRADRISDDHRHLLAALAGADVTVLSRPRGDLRRSTDQPASRWLLDSAARLAGIPSLSSSELDKCADAPWYEHVSSYAGGLARAPVHATEQELRLAQIARGGTSDDMFADDPGTRVALEVVRARRSPAFTRFDGNLTGIAATIVAPQAISATQLERWATCPRAYLFTHLLGVEHVEEPEQRFEIDPLSRGTLMHDILEEFIRTSIDDGHALTEWSNSDRDRLGAITEAQFRRIELQGRTGRALLWRIEQRRIIAELDNLLVHDNSRLLEGLHPAVAEHRFKDIEIALPNGHRLHMRGSVDRIDLAPDGSVIVIDYKTGGDSAYTKLSQDNPHDHGRHLQLYVYSQAAMDRYPSAPSVRAEYWFTKENKHRGYPITAEVQQEVLGAIASIIDGITSGIFPARPADKQPYGWVDCWYCSPDGLSSTIAQRDWARKRTDPALAGYVALSETGQQDGRG